MMSRGIARVLGIGLSVSSPACGNASAPQAVTDMHAATSTDVLQLGPPDVSYSPAHMSDDMLSEYQRIEIGDDADPTLKFDTLVPKAWAQVAKHEPIEHLLGSRTLIVMAPNRLAPGAPRAIVSVAKPQWELPLDAWARMQLTRAGYEEVSGRWFPGANGLYFDITGQRRNQSGRDLVRRFTVHYDGAHVFEMETSCARELWDRHKEDFLRAHATFELHNRTGRTTEPRLTASTVKPGFAVSYPASWSAERSASRVATVSGIQLRLIKPDGATLAAYLVIKAERAPEAALDALREAALATLRGTPIEPSSKLTALAVDEDPRAEAVEGWLGGYTAKAKMGSEDAALRFGFLRRGPLNISMIMLSPKPADDAMVSLRAQRCFEIARSSLELTP